MAVSAADVKKLRDLTNAPMMACKTALEDADGDIEKAADLVRERTGAKMDARAAERTAGDGIVHAYLHAPSPGLPPKVGVMVELKCETDFVAKNEAFRDLAHDVAMHIAAMQPQYVSEEDVDESALERERDFARKEARDEGKPDDIVERIVDGKIRKFHEESVLLNQPFVKDDSRTVADVISEVQAEFGEKIVIGRFARFEV